MQQELGLGLGLGLTAATCPDWRDGGDCEGGPEEEAALEWFGTLEYRALERVLEDPQLVPYDALIAVRALTDTQREWLLGATSAEIIEWLAAEVAAHGVESDDETSVVSVPRQHLAALLAVDVQARGLARAGDVVGGYALLHEGLERARMLTPPPGWREMWVWSWVGVCEGYATEHQLPVVSAGTG